MKTTIVSARLRAVLQNALFVLVLCGAAVAVPSCGGGGGGSSPACNGCTPSTNPTPFTAGQLPGSAATLQGNRCAATGSQLTVFGNQLLATDIATQTATSLSFKANTGFVVYWSVCNVGAGKSDAVTTPTYSVLFSRTRSIRQTRGTFRRCGRCMAKHAGGGTGLQ